MTKNIQDRVIEIIAEQAVLGANDAPVASVDPIVPSEDTPVEGRVVATDVDGDDLTFSLDDQPDGG